jgi:hypothetical protein
VRKPLGAILPADMQLTFTYGKTQVLLSMLLGWCFGYAYFSIRMVHFSGWGYVTDFNSVVFWTSLFSAISTFTFVPLTIKIFNKLTKGRFTYCFPVATFFSSQVALTILLLPFTEFRPFEMGTFYFLYAGVVGFAFGAFYYFMQTKNIFGTSMSKSKKFLVLIATTLLFYLTVSFLPIVSPSIAYRYFGDSIKSRAVRHVLGQLRPGDKLAHLNSRLPGFIGDVFDSGSTAGSDDGFSYDVKFDQGVVTSINLDDSEK